MCLEIEMHNYDGTMPAIIQRKLQDLVSTMRLIYHKDKMNKMMLVLVSANSNPAYRAASIVALKESGTLNKLDNEYKNPSFDIPGIEDMTDGTIPSVFTSRHQPTQEFVEYTEEPDIPETSTILQSNIKIIKDGELFAEFRLLNN